MARLQDPEKHQELHTANVGHPEESKPVQDAVWGDVGEDGPNYRSLGWIRAAVLETKTQIGLGVLGLVRLSLKGCVLKS